MIVLAGLPMYATLGTVRAEQPEEETSGSKLRVGTFDSRAVAMAYFGSEAFNRELNDLRAELEDAKAAGDEQRVKELEAEGPALQELMHKQGFGTWPVHDILDKIRDEIPEIAKQTGVEVIVSKWDIVYQGPGVEFVDVTDLMVRLFDPNEETLDTITDIQKLDPVPLVELTGHQD
ncbi:hypothetical protein IIA79_06410 [bacterium]|nr:hypothetical protein [bacterium]